MQQLEIYGTKVNLPDSPTTDKIENWGTDDPSEQYWRRKELPDIFDEIEYDEDKNPILTPEQKAFAKIEIDRCFDGFYFLNNGQITYITGKNYFYLQWWKLEDGI